MLCSFVVELRALSSTDWLHQEGLNTTIVISFALEMHALKTRLLATPWWPASLKNHYNESCSFNFQEGPKKGPQKGEAEGPRRALSGSCWMRMLR